MFDSEGNVWVGDNFLVGAQNLAHYGCSYGSPAQVLDSRKLKQSRLRLRSSSRSLPIRWPSCRSCSSETGTRRRISALMCRPTRPSCERLFLGYRL